MTLILAILTFLAAVSFALGLYFRVAEYDILAADRVWDRIAPAAFRIVDDERVPDGVAAAVAALSIMTGCGCFTNAMLLDAIRRKFSVARPSSGGLEEQVAELDDETRHVLFNLMRDLVMFDSLHAPILGRLCRAIHRKHFARSKYRFGDEVSPEREQLAIVRIAQAAEAVIARGQAKGAPVPELALSR